VLPFGFELLSEAQQGLELLAGVVGEREEVANEPALEGLSGKPDRRAV